MNNKNISTIHLYALSTIFCLLFSISVFSDNEEEITPNQIDKVYDLLTPGRIMIWSCPTCGHKAEVLSIKSFNTFPRNKGTISIAVQKTAIIAAREGIDKPDKFVCLLHSDEGLELGYEGEWVLDFTYTYYSPDNNNEFLNIGPLFNINNNAVTSLNLSNETMMKIEICNKKINF